MSDQQQPPVVSRAERDSLRLTPGGPESALSALHTVLLFTVTDVFGLVPEETLWTEYHLDEILAPLLASEPHAVPIAVRQELLQGEYGARLAALTARSDRDAGMAHDGTARSASAEDWAAVFMQMITACYHLRPMVESGMRGKLVGLLRELGVDHAEAPRASRYLPNDVRHRLDNGA